MLSYQTCTTCINHIKAQATKSAHIITTVAILVQAMFRYQTCTTCINHIKSSGICYDNNVWRVSLWIFYLAWQVHAYTCMHFFCTHIHACTLLLIDSLLDFQWHMHSHTHTHTHAHNAVDLFTAWMVVHMLWIHWLIDWLIWIDWLIDW